MPPRSGYVFTDVEREGLLLVEGVDDARFCDAFLRNGLHNTNVQIAPVHGKDNFRPSLQVVRSADNFPNLRHLGILRDADDSAASALQSLQDSLRAAGLPVPAHSWESIPLNSLTVSIAILPDGTAPGDLETLCLQSINASHFSCVESYISCMDQAGRTSQPPSKAQLYAYLATGRNPGLRIGEAAEAGVWDWESPAFLRLRQFLQSL